MLRHALRTEPSTSVTLLYGNRTPEDIIFAAELDDLKDRHLGRLTLVHFLSRSEHADAPLLTGRIDKQRIEAFAAPLVKQGLAQAYVCGPGNLIREARATLAGLGLPRERFHHEFFAAGGGAYRKPAAAALNDEIPAVADVFRFFAGAARCMSGAVTGEYTDRKSTRLNSSHRT